jgi:hypothetical protein
VKTLSNIDTCILITSHGMQETIIVLIPTCAQELRPDMCKEGILRNSLGNFSVSPVTDLSVNLSDRPAEGGGGGVCYPLTECG